jgi:hypothetical protein
MSKKHPTPPQPAEGSQIEGEGNYTAARRHRESVEDFVESGKVDAAAQAAAPKDDAEAKAMKQAEKEGKSHAKR